MIHFNEENEVIHERKNRVILVGVSDYRDISYSMEELARLAETAGGEVLGMSVQNMERINKTTYIGRGKVQELKELCINMEADTVIFNEELSGMQIRNLEDGIGVKIVDRTILILDIFARGAMSREGKLQVELAQLQYRLPRLVGFGKELSRLGGGIGTRGPGEKKLETDRRHISRRMDDIKRELIQVKKNRTVQRSNRKRSSFPVVALVGYTNSGKSALMNKILEMVEKDDKKVQSTDTLFATLDTRHRKIERGEEQSFLLADTVGFIDKLPHDLIDAFKSTLEEVRYADLLLHVVDASYPEPEQHIHVTQGVLKEIGGGGKKKIMVYNKTDLIFEDFTEEETSFGIHVSAKTGYGMKKLLEAIDKELFGEKVNGDFFVPYSRGDVVSYIYEKGKVKEAKHEAAGTKIRAELKEEDYRRVEQYDSA